MGRRSKLEPDIRTLATLKKLGEWGATRDEAAAWLDVSRPTLWKFLNEHAEASEAFEAGQDCGKVTLRRWQWDAAKRGNTSMLIWLGKQLLKQRDDAASASAETRESIEQLREAMERKLARLAPAEPAAEVASEPDAA